MLAIKWSDITINPNDTLKTKKIENSIHAENSKTGRSRNIVPYRRKT